jgi:hypothetical protein
MKKTGCDWNALVCVFRKTICDQQLFYKKWKNWFRENVSDIYK